MTEFFLEDILKLTGFNHKDMRKYKEETHRSMNLLLIGSLNHTVKKKCILAFCLTLS